MRHEIPCNGPALTGGSILFVPEEQADVVAAAAGVGSSEPGALRYARFSLDDALWPSCTAR